MQALAQQAVLIEQHYKRPMDIEWAKDGHTGKLFIVQARPETVRSNGQVMERYTLQGKGSVVVEGRAIGHRIGAGEVKVIHEISEMNRIEKGDVLVTDMTDPDWEPIMKKASAIVTNRGGRTCHAAIIARELGIPAVVGCGDATDRLKDGNKVTVSCAEGDTGYVYSDRLDFEVTSSQVDEMPDLPLKIMMNVGNPDRAFDFSCLPNEGVCLARQGMKRGEKGLKVIMMCEIPSSALLAEQFLEHFDGFSIGSNDMTQLALGLDRDSGVVSALFDERNEAVKALLSMAIQSAKKQGKYVVICGQGPTDHQDFAAWLME